MALRLNGQNLKSLGHQDVQQTHLSFVPALAFVVWKLHWMCEQSVLIRAPMRLLSLLCYFIGSWYNIPLVKHGEDLNNVATRTQDSPISWTSSGSTGLCSIKTSSYNMPSKVKSEVSIVVEGWVETHQRKDAKREPHILIRSGMSVGSHKTKEKRDLDQNTPFWRTFIASSLKIQSVFSKRSLL